MPCKHLKLNWLPINTMWLTRQMPTWLILQYSNKECFGINIPGLDANQWSSFQAFMFTNSNNFDKSNSSSRKTHIRFFEKLMKILLRKDHFCHCSHSRNMSFEDLKFYNSDLYTGNLSKHFLDSHKSIHIHSDVDRNRELYEPHISNYKYI